MRWLKKLGWFLGGLCLIHILIWSTGNLHLYPTLQNTVLKGRLGPEIDEYSVFANRKVEAGNHQPWTESFSGKELSEDDLEIHRNLKSVAYVVIKDGEIRYEKYWEKYDQNSKSNSFSMAKSLVSTAIGCALQDGYIQSLDQPVSDFIPEFQGGHQVTLRNLLVMSSGINFDENYINPFAYPARANYGDDLWKLTMSYSKAENAGEVFKYLSGNTQLLAFVIYRATGKTLSSYFSERIWKPIGAKNSALWSLDKEDGYEKAFCCFNSNARDFARIGQLYLNQGNWGGQQLIPTWYVHESVIPNGLKEADGSPCLRYGYQWWLTQYQEKRVFYARGILGQYIIVIPQDELIIVRLGHKRKKPKHYEPPGELTSYIKMAYEVI